MLEGSIQIIIILENQTPLVMATLGDDHFQALDMCAGGKGVI